MFFVASAFFGLAQGSGECLRVVDVEWFTEEYLGEICPETDYETDKTVNAKICPGSTDPITGVPYDVNEATKALREYSLKLAILNKMYSDSDNPASCDYHCMYDPLNVGADGSQRIGFIWRDGCWDLVKDWACFTLGYDEWLHAKDKVSRMCPMDSLAPPDSGELTAPNCLPKIPVEMYTQEYLSTLCPAGKSATTGNTYKDYDNAEICADSNDPITGELWHKDYDNKRAREEGLALALVNQMYGSCSSHCMYDTVHLGAEGGMDTLIAYVWKGGDKQCWHLVNAFGCISGHGQGEYKQAVAKAKTFCEPKTVVAPDTTFADVLARLEVVVTTLRELDEEVGIVPGNSANISALLEFVVMAEARLEHIKQTVTE